MNEKYWLQVLNSRSDNGQSKTCGEPCRTIGNRKLVGCLVILLLLTWWVWMADAQQTGKVARIALLIQAPSAVADFLDAFRKELSKLGWIEGKNLSIEYRFAEQKLDRLPELAAELVNQKVDLIVVGTGQAPFAAKKATSTIPIVMRTSVDPVGAGLIASLARPGGDVTGLSGLSPELNTKRLEILNDAIPRLSRVGYLLTPEAIFISYGRPATKRNQGCSYGTEVEVGGDRTEPDAKSLESAFQTAKQKQVGAIMTAPGGRRMFAQRESESSSSPSSTGCLLFIQTRDMSTRAA